MLVAIVLAARWIVRRWGGDSGSLPLLWVGVWALGLLLTAEIGVGVLLRGRSPVEALLNRDLTFPVIFLIERSLGFALYRSPILPSAIVIKIGLLKIDEKLKPLCLAFA
jgi:hypothetical protein